jgi:hypothetical protein
MLNSGAYRMSVYRNILLVLLVFLILFQALAFSASPSVPPSQRITVTYRYFSPSGLFQLDIPDGSHYSFSSNKPGFVNAWLYISVIRSTDNAIAEVEFKVDEQSLTYQRNLTLDIHLPDMTIQYNNVTLGKYFLWMPQHFENNSIIKDYITVIDEYNISYSLDAVVIKKGGLDYTIVNNSSPYFFLQNAYNDTTGLAVSLMIPGGTGLPTNLVLSGNYTLGHKNIAYTPLGKLLGLSWYDFELVGPYHALYNIQYSPDTVKPIYLYVKMPQNTAGNISFSTLLVYSVSALVAIFVVTTAYLTIKKKKDKNVG